MTPHDLYKTYRHLDVDLLDGQWIIGIDIHEYRNNRDDYLQGEFSTAAGTAAYNELVTQVQKHCECIGQGKYRFLYSESQVQKRRWVVTYSKVHVITTWPDLQRPYVGKGTPDDIRMALRLAVHYELLKPTRPDIQNYCKDNIGLDCSGFASAYYGGQWMGKGADDYRKAPKLTKLEDVRPGDAIVWQNEPHIAVIDKITSKEETAAGIVSSLDCKVAEATRDHMLTLGVPDGLNHTDYHLLFDGPGKFKIMRSIVYNRKDSFHWPQACIVRVS
jgi:hypothetical protein